MVGTSVGIRLGKASYTYTCTWVAVPHQKYLQSTCEPQRSSQYIEHSGMYSQNTQQNNVLDVCHMYSHMNKLTSQMPRACMYIVYSHHIHVHIHDLVCAREKVVRNYAPQWHCCPHMFWGTAGPLDIRSTTHCLSDPASWEPRGFIVAEI